MKRNRDGRGYYAGRRQYDSASDQSAPQYTDPPSSYRREEAVPIARRDAPAAPGGTISPPFKRDLVTGRRYYDPSTDERDARFSTVYSQPSGLGDGSYRDYRKSSNTPTVQTGGGRFGRPMYEGEQPLQKASHAAGNRYAARSQGYAYKGRTDTRRRTYDDNHRDDMALPPRSTSPSSTSPNTYRYPPRNRSRSPIYSHHPPSPPPVDLYDSLHPQRPAPPAKNQFYNRRRDPHGYGNETKAELDDNEHPRARTNGRSNWDEGGRQHRPKAPSPAHSSDYRRRPQLDAPKPSLEQRISSKPKNTDIPTSPRKLQSANAVPIRLSGKYPLPVAVTQKESEAWAPPTRATEADSTPEAIHPVKATAVQFAIKRRPGHEEGSSKANGKPSPIKRKQDTESSMSTDTSPEMQNGGSAGGRPSGAYERLVQVGEGTYGKVYKARHLFSRELVAMKKIRMEMERDGFPITALREIKLLQSIRHPNIVHLLEIMVEKDNVYMVFEYLDHDLAGILNHPAFTFEPAHTKYLMRQLLEGLRYLHHKSILHRDIKGSNILISNSGILKIADFGLARHYHKRRQNLDYTNRVITLWYRSPELLLGATTYGASADLWSVGCIMLEIFTKRAAFSGKNEIQQLELIFAKLGTPDQDTWPGVISLPWWEFLKPQTIQRGTFEADYDQLSPGAAQMAKALLSLDPGQRPTAAEALAMPYFKEEAPDPQPPKGLNDLKGEWHDFESKMRRKPKSQKV